MRRTWLVLVLTMVLMLGVVAGPAFGHVLEVDPPGGGQGPPAGQWVGGPPLPEAAQGEGLVVGGPPGEQFLQPPSHAEGLNHACEATQDNDVVSMWGPPFPETCNHGGPPPAE